MEKILLIEDNIATIQHATFLLSHAGYEVLVAKDWIEANILVFDPNKRPDLILVDINLGPSLTGEKIAEVYSKQREKFDQIGGIGKVGIYLFSSREEEELKFIAQKVGADGYIHKKKGLFDLVDKVKEYFNKIQLAQKDRDSCRFSS
jgi:CheY-like chemotaxis protein